MRLIPLIALASLSACASVSFSGCPVPRDYAPGFLQRAADELVALPPDSPLAQMIIDYQVLRDQVRACRASR